MTLPASGQITLQQILTEFGAPAGTGLLAMVRGGAYVPNIPQNSGVPTAPPIGLTDFYGAANQPPVNFGSHQIDAFEWADGVLPFSGPGVDPLIPDWQSSSATYIIRHTGTTEAWWTTGAQDGSSASLNYPGEWLIGGSAASYDVLATITSGSGANGTFGSWLNLGTTRSWGFSHFGAGVASCTVSFQVRPAGGGANVDSFTITFTCERPN